MLCNVYVRKGIVYVPSVARTEAGYYLDQEPVEVASAKDEDAVRKAIKEGLDRGNRVVPTPTRANFPTPVVLKYAKVKSWSSFEREAEAWTASDTDGRYRIGRLRNRSDRGWEEDPTAVEFLRPGSSNDDVADRMAHLIRNGA